MGIRHIELLIRESKELLETSNGLANEALRIAGTEGNMERLNEINSTLGRIENRMGEILAEVTNIKAP